MLPNACKAPSKNNSARSCFRKVCEKCSKSKVKLTDTKKKSSRACDLCIKQRGLAEKTEERKVADSEMNNAITHGNVVETRGLTCLSQYLEARHVLYATLLAFSLITRLTISVQASSAAHGAHSYLSTFGWRIFAKGVWVLRSVSSPLGFAVGLTGLIFVDEMYRWKEGYHEANKTAERSNRVTSSSQDDVVLKTADQLSFMQGFSADVLQAKLKSLTADPEV